MKRIGIGVFVLGLGLCILGCSGGKRVSTLEKQLAQEQAEKAALTAQVEFLRKNLSETLAVNDSLQALLDRPVTPPQPQALPPETTGAQAAAPPEPVVAKEPVPEDLPVVKPGSDFQAGYERARGMFNQRQYVPAAQAFAALLESDRNHRLASNCQYWIGECLYAQRKYESALAEFQKVFAYPLSNKADVSQYKIGMCYMQMGKKDAAREEFNRLIAAYPSSEYVVRARAQLDKIP